MPAEIVNLKIHGQSVSLRILRENTHQRRGFQLVEHINPHEGLLYLLHTSKQTAFWMKDVVHHLDIVFVDKEGRVVDVAEGKPHREDKIIPPTDARYVIKFPKGTANALNLIKGKIMNTNQFSLLTKAFKAFNE